MGKGVFVFIFGMLCSIVLPAQDNTPKYSNEFLNIGVDARAFGLGLSMVSHTADASSGYWNPAGLSKMEPDHQLVLMHSAYFAGISNYDYGAFATRLDDSSALSVSVIRFAVDDIADTRLLFDANGSVNYDNIRFFSGRLCFFDLLQSATQGTGRVGCRGVLKSFVGLLVILQDPGGLEWTWAYRKPGNHGISD